MSHINRGRCVAHQVKRGISPALLSLCVRRSAGYFRLSARQGYSGQDQRYAYEHGRCDTLIEDQDPEHDRDHGHQVGHCRCDGRAAAGDDLELMDRMGHSTTRAAYIYQHRTSLRDKMIADQISARVGAERLRSGTQRARDNEESS